jgi:hypothetical protein
MLRVLPTVLVLALLIYLVVRLIQRRGHGGSSFRRRPIAPDDDPTFLKKLDSQLWEQRRGGKDDPPVS